MGLTWVVVSEFCLKGGPLNLKNLELFFFSFFLFLLFFWGCFLFQPVCFAWKHTMHDLLLRLLLLVIPLIFRHWSPGKTPAHKLFAAATICSAETLFAFWTAQITLTISSQAAEEGSRIQVFFFFFLIFLVKNTNKSLYIYI